MKNFHTNHTKCDCFNAVEYKMERSAFHLVSYSSFNKVPYTKSMTLQKSHVLVRYCCPHLINGDPADYGEVAWLSLLCTEAMPFFLTSSLTESFGCYL